MRRVDTPGCNEAPARRAVIKTIMTAVAGMSWLGSSARAQGSYPTKPVRLVVPFPAGTSPDVIARLWAERFSRLAGQPVVVDNRPGAGTIIAAQQVANAPADGYTLFWTVNNTLSINPFVYKKLPYKADDFVPITQILSVPFVLVVSPDSPIRTLADLMQRTKTKAGGLSYASPGVGTSPHVIMARLLNAAGVQMTHVPYKDSFAPDVMAGRIDAAFDASTTAIPFVKDGKLRALAVSSPNRMADLKDVPSIAESYPGFQGESWHGVFAPKGTPEAVVRVVEDRSRVIVQSAEFRDKLASLGLTPVGSTGSDFNAFLQADARAWEQVVRTNGIALD